MANLRRRILLRHGGSSVAASNRSLNECRALGSSLKKPDSLPLIMKSKTEGKTRQREGMLKLRTTKTGTDVEVPLHPDVVAALGKLAAASGYYFWDGLSNQQTLVKLWDAAFMRLFKRAGIAAGHCHRFRHTFATRLLQKGISMENLATLLGHRDTKITQRHYAAWVPGRQAMLKKEIAKTW
jgi:integrase